MKLEKPEMEIVEFEAEDIICTSGCDTYCKSNCPNDGSVHCEPDMG